MNWVEHELAPPPDPQDAWLFMAPVTECEHRFRVAPVPAALKQFYSLANRSICRVCGAEA